MTLERDEYPNLDAALAAHRIPLANHDLIRTFTSAIGIATYVDRGDCIKAERRGGHAALNITYGWTNGFVDLDEARRVCGDSAEVWASKRAAGMAGVTHPENTMRDGSARASRPERPEASCPTCFTVLPATGVCQSPSCE